MLIYQQTDQEIIQKMAFNALTHAAIFAATIPFLLILFMELKST
jgi:hypothetical protein